MQKIVGAYTLLVAKGCWKIRGAAKNQCHAHLSQGHTSRQQCCNQTVRLPAAEHLALQPLYQWVDRLIERGSFDLQEDKNTSREVHTTPSLGIYKTKKDSFFIASLYLKWLFSLHVGFDHWWFFWHYPISRDYWLTPHDVRNKAGIYRTAYMKK